MSVNQGLDPLEYLEYCRVRYRSCWSYARWAAARLVGVDEEPDVGNAVELFNWLRDEMLRKLEEESRGYRSALEDEAERRAVEALKVIVAVLARQYG